MKKRILSAAIILLIIITFPLCALADNYCNLSNVFAGSPVNYRVGTLSDGSYAICDTPPAGLNVQLIDGSVYVIGAPVTAGNYQFVIYTDDTVTGNIICDITVNASVPEVSTSADVDCFVGDSVRLSAGAFSPDGSPLSYQWFAGSTPDGLGGYQIIGANGSEYFPNTGSVGTTYYYCAVTGNNNGQLVTAASRAIRVTVTQLQVTNIMVNTLPTEIQYVNGQLVNAQGVSIEAFFANGTSKILWDGFSLSTGRYDADTGILTMIAEYQGNTCSFPVNVPNSEAQIAALGMAVLPAKQNYTVGESIDPTGIVFRVFYTDDTYADMSSDFTLDPTYLNAVGIQTVRLYHKGKVCSFEVYVAERTAVPDTLEVASTTAKPTSKIKLPDTSKLTSIPTGQANKGAIITILVIALLALGALVAYMLVLEYGGMEEIKYKIECKLYNIRSPFNKKKK